MPAPLPDAEDTRWRMRAIADELYLAGLATRLHESRTSIDVTATLTAVGQRETEVTVDFSDRPCRRPPRPASLLLAA